MATDARSIYVTALRNTHAMEQQGLQQMEAQVSRLERYPDYVALLQRHIETTRQQLARLEQALQSAGESISSIKETVTTVAGTVGATVHGLFQDETLKNLYAGYAYQYEQIGAYRSLITIAESAGETAHISAFQQSVREEEQAAQEVAAIIEPVTRRYVELTTSGEKADREATSSLSVWDAGRVAAQKGRRHSVFFLAASLSSSADPPPCPRRCDKRRKLRRQNGQNTRNTDLSLLLTSHVGVWPTVNRGAVMQVDNLETLYTACIAKLRSAEQQGLQAYDMMLQKARHPELRQALEQHRTETEQQIQRLEQIIQRSGGSTMQVEDEIMPAILRENQKMQSMIASDELSDVSLIAGAQIGEHYEIAAYGTAAAHAKLLGRQEDLQLLLQTLEEEKRTDELLTQIAERSVNQQAQA